MKLKDIKESLAPALEGRIDNANKILRGVAIASTRRSKNGWTYSDRSFNTLTSMVEGANFFINHPSKSEQRDRDSVRDIRDFSGVFHNGRRTGDRITADLHVHDQHWEFMKSVVKLQPANIGMSINSQVRVVVDKNTGQEQITDIANLRSVDFVSTPALNTTIWESIQNDKESDTYNLESAFDAGYEAALEKMTEEYREGILADKIKDDEIRQKANKLLYKAQDLINDILYDRDKKYGTFTKQRDAITNVLDDLEAELKKVIPNFKSESKKELKDMAIPKEMTEFFTRENTKAEKEELEQAVNEALTDDAASFSRSSGGGVLYRKQLREKFEINEADEIEVLEALNLDTDGKVTADDEDDVLAALINTNRMPE